MERFYIVNRKLSVLMFIGMLLTLGALRIGYAAPVFNDKFWDGTNWVAGKTTRALPQNLASGTELGPPLKVTSTGTNLTYSLGGTDAATFTVDSATGQLKTAAVLNYNDKTEHDVTVTATDSTGSDTIDVKILVSEPYVPPWLPDYTPWPIEYAVSGIVPAGTVVGKVYVLPDGDGDPVHCYLSVKTSDYASFTIDWEKGDLTTTKPLDYHDQKTYKLIYVSTDAWIQHQKQRPNVEGFALEWEVEITLDGTELLALEAQAAAARLAEEEKKAAAEALRRQKRAIIRCPVGWKDRDPFGASTQHALIHCLNLELDANDRSNIYKATEIEIYTNPEDNFENLEGWTLKLGTPYNRHTDYLLTAENSVIGEDGIARIQSPEGTTFPMSDVYFSGQRLPGFDYRLFDAEGKRVDFAISCYRQPGFAERLRLMEGPCVVRKITPHVEKGAAVKMETDVTIDRLDWTGDYYLSVWIVPEAGRSASAAPSAPSALKKPVVTTWAALKGGKK